MGKQPGYQGQGRQKKPAKPAQPADQKPAEEQSLFSKVDESKTPEYM